MQARAFVLPCAFLGVTLPPASTEALHPLDSPTATKIQAATKVLSVHPSFPQAATR